MNTGTAQAITSVLGGATQGVLDAYKIKRMSDESKKSDDDTKYEEELAAIGADPIEEPPLDTGVKPPDGMPPSREGVPTSPDPAPDAVIPKDEGATDDGYDYQPSRFAAMPDSLKFFKADIIENEARAKVAMKHGRASDAIRFRRYAREAARMADQALDSTGTQADRAMKLKEGLEKRRAMGLVDGFDLAMQGDPSAENFIAQGTETQFWPKPGTLKADKKAGTVSYTMENGQPRTVSKSERDTWARRFEYPKAGNDMTSEATSYRKQMADELAVLQEKLKEMDNPESGKNTTLWTDIKNMFGFGPETADGDEKIKAALKAEIADRQKTLKGLDKQIRKGLSTDIESTESDEPPPGSGGDEAEPAPAAGTLDTSAAASNKSAPTNDAATPPQFKSGTEAKAWIQGTYKDKIGSGEVVEVVINGKPVQVKL